MPKMAINLRNGNSLCDVEDCVGLHERGMCYSFNELEKLIARRCQGKERDNADKLCGELAALQKLIGNPQTKVLTVMKKIRHISQRFGGTDKKLRAAYYRGCLQILRQQRKGFRQLRRHNIPEFENQEQILTAISNWPYHHWTAQWLGELCEIAIKRYKATEKQLEQALSIHGLEPPVA